MVGLIKEGSGDLTLTGANAHGGTTAIGDGTLQVSDGGTIPSGTVVVLGDAVANTSGVLELGNDQTIAGLQTAGTGTGNAVVGGTFTTATLTIDAVAGEPNGDTFRRRYRRQRTEQSRSRSRLRNVDPHGGEQLQLSPRPWTSATLQIGDGDATGSLGAGAVTDIGSLVFDCGGDTAVDNPISGTGSLTQEGAFTVTLDGGNSYSGGTEIDAGNLAFGSTAAIGTGNASGNITVNDGVAPDVPRAVHDSHAVARGRHNQHGFQRCPGAYRRQFRVDRHDRVRLPIPWRGHHAAYYGVLSNPDDNTCIFGGGVATLTIPNALGDVDDVQTNVVIQGDVTFAATNTYSGTTTVSAGTLQVGDGGTTGCLGSLPSPTTPRSGTTAATTLTSVMRLAARARWLRTVRTRSPSAAATATRAARK